MKSSCVYCGAIGKKCPNKIAGGRCKTDGKTTNEYDKIQDCEHAVNIVNRTNRFFVEYLYKIRNGAPRHISVVSTPVNNYPEDLYCTHIDEMCPYQSPGGKCTLIQCMEGRDSSTQCDYQMNFDKEPELITRLIQFVHKDIEQLKKENAELQKQIAELQQNQK